MRSCNNGMGSLRLLPLRPSLASPQLQVIHDDEGDVNEIQILFEVPLNAWDPIGGRAWPIGHPVTLFGIGLFVFMALSHLARRRVTKVIPSYFMYLFSTIFAGFLGCVVVELRSVNAPTPLKGLGRLLAPLAHSLNGPGFNFLPHWTTNKTRRNGISQIWNDYA